MTSLTSLLIWFVVGSANGTNASNGAASFAFVPSSQSTHTLKSNRIKTSFYGKKSFLSIHPSTVRRKRIDDYTSLAFKSHSTKSETSRTFSTILYSNQNFSQEDISNGERSIETTSTLLVQSENLTNVTNEEMPNAMQIQSASIKENKKNTQTIPMAKSQQSVPIEEIEQIADEDKNEKISQGGIPPEFKPILVLLVLVTFLSALDRVAMSIAILPLSSEYYNNPSPDYISTYSPNNLETIKGLISSSVSYGYGLAILPIGLLVSVVSSRVLMSVGVLLWSLATLGTPLMAMLSASMSDVSLSNGALEGLESASAAGAIGSIGAVGGVILWPLLLVRATMGAAEAVVLPTMQRLLANWIPPQKKATALSIILAGFQLGTLSAYLISPWVLEWMTGLDGGGVGSIGSVDIGGWRGLFYVYGVLGLGWLIPWWLVANDGPSNKSEVPFEEECKETLVNSMIGEDASLVLKECPISEEETASTGATNDTKSRSILQLLQSAPWIPFLQSPGVWAMTLSHASKNWFLYNLLAWAPTFYSEEYGLNVKESALYSILPSVCGMIGGLTAGNTADFFLSKMASNDNTAEEPAISDEKRTNLRKIFQSIALFGPATCLFLLSNLSSSPEQVNSVTAAQLLLGGSVFTQAFDAAGFGAATQEKAGEKWAGLLYSFTSLPGVMVGSVSVGLTGRILDWYKTNDNGAINSLNEDGGLESLLRVMDAVGLGGHGDGWSAVFELNAAVCVIGALCFLFLYDSKKEFD